MASPGHKVPCRNKANQFALAGYTLDQGSKVMMDQQNFVATPPGVADPEVALAKALGQWPKPRAPKPRALSRKAAPATAPSVEILAKELGLTLAEQTKLTIRRIKRGKSYS